MSRNLTDLAGSVFSDALAIFGVPVGTGAMLLGRLLTKDISLRLLDADGTDVVPAMTQQVAFEVKSPRLVGTMQLVMQMGGIEFQKYGAYALHLLLQGNEIGSVSFNITEPPSTA